MEQWYTLHTKPNAEYQVITALKQRDIETYLPEIGTPTANKGKCKLPFFPCYLFARIDFELVGFSKVQWTPGLRRIVAFDEQPFPLRDELIELIHQYVDHLRTTGSLPQHNFNPGDTVRIKEGPFQDMLAIFAGPTTPAQRVQVLLEILGEARRLKLAVTDLEKAPVEAEISVTKRPRRTRGRGRWITSTNQSSHRYSQL
jgi:transcription elongation factor/antiterminator RfaH